MYLIEFTRPLPPSDAGSASHPEEMRASFDMAIGVDRGDHAHDAGRARRHGGPSGGDLRAVGVHREVACLHDAAHMSLRDRMTL